MKYLRPLLIASVGFFAIVAIWLAYTNQATPNTSPTRTYETPVSTPAEIGEIVPSDPAAPNDDPKHTAAMFVQTAFAYLPAEDSTPRDALRRAQRYTTGQLHDAGDVENKDYKPTQNWQNWKESKDFIVVSTKIESVTSGASDTMTVRVWGQQTVSALIPLAPFTIDVELAKANGLWLAERYELVSGAPTV